MASESVIVPVPRGAPINRKLQSIFGYHIQAGFAVFMLHFNYDVQGDGYADNEGFVYHQLGKYPINCIFAADDATFNKEKRTVDMVGIGSIGNLIVQVTLNITPIIGKPNTFYKITFHAVLLDDAGHPTTQVIYPEFSLVKQLLIDFVGAESAGA